MNFTHPNPEDQKAFLEQKYGKVPKNKPFPKSTVPVATKEEKEPTKPKVEEVKATKKMDVPKKAVEK